MTDFVSRRRNKTNDNLLRSTTSYDLSVSLQVKNKVRKRSLLKKVMEEDANRTRSLGREEEDAEEVEQQQQPYYSSNYA